MPEAAKGFETNLLARGGFEKLDRQGPPREANQPGPAAPGAGSPGADLDALAAIGLQANLGVGLEALEGNRLVETCLLGEKPKRAWRHISEGRLNGPRQ